MPQVEQGAAQCGVHDDDDDDDDHDDDDDDDDDDVCFSQGTIGCTPNRVPMVFVYLLCSLGILGDYIP